MCVPAGIWDCAEEMHQADGEPNLRRLHSSMGGHQVIAVSV